MAESINMHKQADADGKHPPMVRLPPEIKREVVYPPFLFYH